MIRICPSILNADHDNLASEMAKVSKDADLIHLDIMDNIFVPNKTFSLNESKEIISQSSLPVDAHLMVINPDVVAPAYAQMGCKSVTFHYEAAESADSAREIAKSIREYGSRVGLAPVLRLSEEACEIGPNNRAQRLRLPSLPLELAQLGASFNAALDRLDDAYHQLATFNDDVAHELRTPLGNLIGQTQVALSRERDAGHLQDILQSNLEELERLRVIVADMLFLARADQGERANRLAPVSIAQEVEKTAEFLDMLFDEADLRVRIVGDQLACIETSLFRRALTNLLQNAIQYAKAGTTITAKISVLSGHAHIAISNCGEVISPAHINHIFDRFYRVDSSRTNFPEHAGHGLGLAIVKAIATMHEGTVFAHSQGGITTIGFTVAIG